MTIKKRRFLLLLATLCLFAVSTYSQEVSDNCEAHPKLLRNKYGKPVRFTYKQLKGRAIHCETLRLPGTWDAKGRVLVKVLVNPEGIVECAKSLNGHPLLNNLAEKAARKWTFKPVKDKENPVAVTGILWIFVSWDYEEAQRKQCK